MSKSKHRYCPRCKRLVVGSHEPAPVCNYCEFSPEYITVPTQAFTVPSVEVIYSEIEGGLSGVYHREKGLAVIVLDPTNFEGYKRHVLQKLLYVHATHSLEEFPEMVRFAAGGSIFADIEPARAEALRTAEINARVAAEFGPKDRQVA